MDFLNCHEPKGTMEIDIRAEKRASKMSLVDSLISKMRNYGLLSVRVRPKETWDQYSER